MKHVIRVTAATLILLLVLDFFGLCGANPEIETKVRLFNEALNKDGYAVRGSIISEERNKNYNSLLVNSVKKSHHLNGDAFDVYVIDGNDKFNKYDVDMVRKYNKNIEMRHSE